MGKDKKEYHVMLPRTEDTLQEFQIRTHALVRRAAVFGVKISFELL